MVTLQLDKWQAELVSEAIAYRIERLQREHVDQYTLESLDAILKQLDAKIAEETPELKEREGHPGEVPDLSGAMGTFGAFRG